MNSISSVNRRIDGNIMLLALILSSVLVLISMTGLQRIQQHARLAGALEQNLHLRAATIEVLNRASAALAGNPLPQDEGDSLAREFVLSDADSPLPLHGRWHITALSASTPTLTNRYFKLSAQAETRHLTDLQSRPNRFGLDALYARGSLQGIRAIQVHDE